MKTDFQNTMKTDFIRGYINVIVIMTITLITAASCQKAPKHSDHQAPGAEAASAHYTCPMHPQINSDRPGQCPICGMDLVPASTGAIMLTATQERLANVRVQRLGNGNINDEVLLNARVVPDEEQRTTVNSRAAGRIEKLYVRETGRPISAGQPLYDLYSEALNGQIQEYLILKDQYSKLGDQRDHYASLVKGAESKLLLYGLSRNQIGQLTRSTTQVTFTAPASGQVTDLLVAEGQYVSAGTPMFRLDNLAKLWLEVELYPTEAMGFEVGDVLSARIAGVTKPINARVSFLAPVLRGNEQVLVMRARLDNADGAYIPGMQATVQRQQQRHEALQLPVDAVIRDGKNAFAFVRAGDHAYQLRVVATGAENSSAIEITNGLSANDEVVVSGAYLLYSELVLRNGADFMAHSNH
jgi:Cu(I)/Ag(I) efflux system membrane fusion protein